MVEYIKYQHVEKIGGEGCDGVLDGVVYIFPKLDGTNAQAWMAGDNSMHYGSRNRELSMDSDNAGFMAWASGDAGLQNLLSVVGNEHRIFGEWLVPHTLKSYDDSAWRRFYVFDIVSRFTGRSVNYEVLADLCEKAGYDDYIKPIYILRNPGADDIAECAKHNSFMMKDGIGEGVVCKNYDYTNKFGKQVWGKHVMASFRGMHRRKPEQHELTDSIEFQIVEHFLTREIIDKVVCRIGTDQPKGNKIAALLETVHYDFINECMYDAAKKFKNPKVCFKMLRKMVIEKIKQTVPEMF